MKAGLGFLGLAPLYPLPVPHASTPRTIAIAAGSNLGDAAASVRRAFATLAASPLIHAPRLSALYRTAPVRVSPDGPDPGGVYVNAAIIASSSATNSILASSGREQNLWTTDNIDMGG